MESFESMIGHKTTGVIDYYKRNGFEVTLMKIYNNSNKSIFYVRNQDTWIEFCTTVKNGIFGNIVWAGDYNLYVIREAKYLEFIDRIHNPLLN